MVPHFKQQITQGIPDSLPPRAEYDPSVSHAPVRNIKSLLTKEEKALALSNALRYFPKKWHKTLAPEFADELAQYGRIYMYRFRPTYPMYARPIEEYPAKCRQAAAIMLMIQNNLDPKVAKHPHELITYGGNGAVFQNWAQYLITMKYLSQLSEDQTLVMYSGHPLGVFPSHIDAPRVVVTNGMMIPNYSSKEDWNKYNAMGVTQYGQMTAGSFMYIGPQGIVHGTTLTLLNAGRLQNIAHDHLAGKVYLTSGLGGMSGAQALAATITGAVGIIAEVDPDAIHQRLTDGYIQKENVFEDLNDLFKRAKNAVQKQEAVALIYSGNVVDLWEACVDRQFYVDLASDQTSLHNIDDLGYCPAGYTFEEAKNLLLEDKVKFLEEVRKSLWRHVEAINKMSDRGTFFWDYGNAFLKEAGDARAEIWDPEDSSKYRYPSYVENIMGPMCFDFGFGPFRWVCCSGTMDDLKTSDHLALEVMRTLKNEAPESIHSQMADNIRWIEEAEEKIPVVGSKSRILYADAWGRIRIALAFNNAIRAGIISAPIVLGRDHHDVSGTDSPFRETANIRDGSKFTADMAIHNVIGDAFRGATWVSIHNGGGVGWGEVINGGFGMVIDGSQAAENRIKSMLHWDVNNGIARRAWARNPAAIETAERAMAENPQLSLTLPVEADETLIQDLVRSKLSEL